MEIQRSAVGIVVQTPAKLNLFFEVLARRGDGFHEIETLMIPVGLYDTLFFQEDPSGQIELRCDRALAPVAAEKVDPEGALPEGIEVGGLPEGHENLVWRAVELLRRRVGVEFGATLRLVKRIPTAAGLGGGSSDAAAALMAANQGWGLGLSPAELSLTAAELGSDVPFFLAGGPAICRGRGERVEPTATAGTLHFVVARPPGGLATASVYGRCRPAVKPREAGPMAEALARGDIKRIGRLLFNRLQPAAMELSPWIRQLQQQFAGEDFLGYGMSGSGTSYFGLCRHARHARRIARRLEANGAGSVFVVRSCR